MRVLLALGLALALAGSAAAESLVPQNINFVFPIDEGLGALALSPASPLPRGPR
ncbi:MAG: hypothetical protein JWQ29_885 [Phenylobacterium sp.]|nr:hypothetical protein [Phenylobacterium sp.]